MGKRIERLIKTQIDRPIVFDKPACVYICTDSRYPEHLRVSFGDGHVMTYDLRMSQPPPVLHDSKSERKFQVGYKFKHARRQGGRF